MNDHQRIHENDDIDAVLRAYPDVVTIQQLEDFRVAYSRTMWSLPRDEGGS